MKGKDKKSDVVFYLKLLEDLMKYHIPENHPDFDLFLDTIDEIKKSEAVKNGNWATKLNSA